MKKRSLPMFLSLVLCFGLAVPAFAEEEAHPAPSISIGLPDGYAAREETEVYQIRHFNCETVEEVLEHITAAKDIYSYSEEASAEELTVTLLPLGASIRISDTYRSHVEVSAWSDPEGDGIYEERIFSWEMLDVYRVYTLCPLGEGPYIEESYAFSGYSTTAEAGTAGFPQAAAVSPMITTSDALYKLYGPNTIIKITATPYDGEREELACLRLTGETAPPAVTVFVSNDSTAPKQDMEFTLRNITEKYHPDNYLAAIYTDFTRNDETETVELKDVDTLTPRGVIHIGGIEAVADGQEPWARVNLSAWSDPDGDGVYDQQLFTCYGATDSIYMVPLSQPGPFTFREIDYREGMPGYSRSVNICGTDKLTSRPYSPGETPSSLILGFNYLTWLFGPDTLVKIQPVTAGRYENGSLVMTEGPASYCYIPADAVAAPAFNDVPVWCQPAVYWAVENEITTGTSYTQFSPEKTCSHAMILTFLWRAAGELEAQAPCPVTLPASMKYAEDALRWAAEKGMIDETLDPAANCTRASAVSYIWQALGKESASASGFDDVPAGADYAAAVDWAVANGIVEGYPDGAFHPDTICNRGVIATMLHRAYVPEVRLP